MEKRIAVEKFRNDIRRLPSDEPVSNTGLRYQTQKQHWLGWLYHYDGPGAYGREPGMNRDAKYAYNHIVCPGLLLYLIHVIGIDPELATAAKEKIVPDKTLMQIAGEIRKIVPWSLIYKTMYGYDGNPGLFNPDHTHLFDSKIIKLQSLSNFLYKSRR